ncbi:MAG: RluA family pseudouridine synthase [Desulfuromonadales bacterium]|nr:RluA family pseudouridine synthase [Desulfuromonadales bacterium]
MNNDDPVLALTKRMHWNIAVPTEDAGLRLDQTLPRHCTGLSRTQARKIIDIGGVHVAGRRVRSCSRSVKGGEEIAVYCDGLPLDPFALSADAILYRDADIIALNKPAGIDTQPTPSRFQGTLYAALSEHLIDPFRRHLEPSIGMVQRLDRDTSGVILFSISPRAHKPLTAAITTHALRKTYLALVAGVVPPGVHEIKSLLARSHRDNCVRSISKGGKEAVTHYHSLAACDTCSLVEVTPITGRMHQIRVHLSEAGFPLLGDTRYGGPKQLGEISVPRHMLHAKSLDFLHPLTRQPLLITAPLAVDFQLLLNHFHLNNN